MKEFLFACIDKKNTKYFTYLRFFITGIILIPVLFISIKTALIAQADVLVDLTTPTVIFYNPLTNVQFYAYVTGTAIGLIDYRLYCLSSDVTPNVTILASSSATVNIESTCGYSSVGSYTPRIRVTREGYTAEDTVLITITDHTVVQPRVYVGTCTMPTNDIVNAGGTMGGLGEVLNCYFCSMPPPQPTTCCNVMNPSPVSTAAPYQPYWEIIGTSKTATIALTPTSTCAPTDCSRQKADGCSPGICTYAWDTAGIDISDLSPGDYTLRIWNHSPDIGGVWAWGICNFTKNGPPEIPILVAPPHNAWINYMPIFQADVFDFNEGDVVAAVFEVSGYNAGGSAGSFLSDNGPGVSFWGPVAINDGDWWWRAWAIDSNDLKSTETGYWLMRKDTVLPMASIDQENGISGDTNITVNLSEDDDRSGVAEGDVDVSWRLIGVSTWGNWVDTDLPNNGSIIDDFVYSGVRGYEYQFRYKTKDNAGNWSDYSIDGMVAIPFNSEPSATNLNRNVPDFCSASPAYFFSWIYSDTDLDEQSRFDFQADDSGATFPSPEINRSYSGLSNPSPTTNNQAVTILLSPQADHLTYGHTYNWRVRVYDGSGLDSEWVSGTAFTTPSHHSPFCNFIWSPTSLNPEEVVNFNDTSICYDAGENVIPCVGWSWIFTDGNPATSTQQNPTVEFTTSGTKNVTLTVIDSFGSQCSIARQVVVSLLPSKWREIRPW